MVAFGDVTLNMRRLVRRFWFRSLFRLGRRRVIQDVEVSILWPDAPYSHLITKIEAALEVMREHAPQSLKWLRRYGSILVFGNEGPNGEWYGDGRLMKLSERHVASEKKQPAHIAATIVHETSHAWLEHRGIEYIPEHRRRIEAMCYRAEARFAARIPGGEKLSDYYDALAQRVLADGDEKWSDEAFRARDIARLVALDTPPWLLHALGVSDDEIAATMEEETRT